MTLDAHAQPPSELDASSAHASLREMSSPSDSASPQGVVAHELTMASRPGLAKCKNLRGTGVQFSSDVQISQRVRSLRGLLMGLLDMRGDEVADFWGYSESTIGNWMSGRTEPKVTQWEQIRDASLERLAAGHAQRTGTNG